jgi:prepilin-type N-terminal cleavage/methylation domain-containing protein
MSSRISRTFTLLEMLIAIVILSFIASFTAIQIKKLLDSHKFESQVSYLFIALQEAQVLSSVYQTDIALDIYRKDGKLHYRFFTNEPFKAQLFSQNEKSLSSADKIQFNAKKTDTLHFDIYSGRVEPRGILGIVQDNKKLWIDLQYGQLLKFSYHKPEIAKLEVPKEK